jgi:hypothetical protein
MKLAGAVGTAVLSLTLGIGIPAWAQQDQHDQQEDKDRPAQEKEKKAQPEKAQKPEEKSAQADKDRKPEEKNAQADKDRRPEEKSAQEHSQPKPEEHARAGRIPDDRFKANFGREHSFRVSEGDYRNRRFQYGGYWFGFESEWPSNWLYTQNVYVIEINGVYYLCNASYPGVNLVLNLTL